ncbi:C-terminal helicase domain-containing protein, partial [Xanthomonas oryzae]
ALPLHGELSQGRRERTLRAFKQADVQVLVATDLAARGIDIDALPAVLNYDLPRSTVDYTHRIGRT